MIKKHFFLPLCALASLGTKTALAQQVAPPSGALNLDSCYVFAQRNYALVQQYALIERAKNYSIETANKGYLPQFAIIGQATYQSDVTKIPISLPNLTITELSKDQYRFYGELVQPITDLFTLQQQKDLIGVNSGIETEKLTVELYKLKERVNQLYFGILLLDAQLNLINLLKKDIKNGIEKAQAAVGNGIALKSSIDVLNAELLKTEQREIEFKATRKGFLDMLALFIRQPLAETTALQKPIPILVNNNINRPELRLFDAQEKTFMVQRKMIDNKTLPRFNLFFQGGLGRPALNGLSNDLQSYYVTGLRLNWNVTSFYTTKQEKQLLDVQQKSLDLQKDVFLFNTNLLLQQQNAEITKLMALVAMDKQIMQLRENIQQTTKKQLEFGTATTNDWLLHLNAKEQAAQNETLHELQLLIAQYNLRWTSAN